MNNEEGGLTYRIINRLLGGWAVHEWIIFLFKKEFDVNKEQEHKE